MDPLCKLDPAVEAALLDIAEDFVDSTTAAAAALARHRRGMRLTGSFFGPCCCYSTRRVP